ncbi:site-specific integrase [Bacteroides caccae]|uniref:site-specific integrase n=2 Tax=Bacteroides caccae TaxID=47678 RepID=UPI0012303884|nr:site-specific integrase [Bacteroides caccae]KAA5451112.1 tyrosine-type recombinase/integrase [Bacteroides caccae]KAA5454689.1 tyrosine-type recombinase/integrase [Bacteroides caccae]KAA5459675.1 tyrosine-type recombinase/integrase [Bacteroides caccae]KAA5473797.1 tyrosine-type recombinase/integrase [Bacteroides caccae]
MERQIFINEMQARFNLRKPRSEKPTNLYLVCRINNKQVKLSTGVKIYPDHWNEKRQEAYISVRLSELDNINNTIVNKKITKLKEYFIEFKHYLCMHPDEIGESMKLLKQHIYKDRMKKELQKPATFIMKQIIEAKTCAESSKKQYRSNIDKFERFLKENEIPNTWESMNLDTINRYQKQIIKENPLHPHNTLRNIIKGTIFNLLGIADKRLDIPFKWSDSNLNSFEFVKDKSNKELADNKKVSLTEEQLNKFYKHIITGTERQIKKYTEIRDLFILQCLVGQRIGDMQKFFNGDNEMDEEAGTISIIQQKTKARAIIPLLPLAKEIISKYENKELLYYKERKSIVNEALKEVAEQAGLDEPITYEENGIKQTQPLYKLLHTHTARHTFITILCRKGIPKETVIIATGHEDTKMIDKVYSHLNSKDKAKKVSNAFKSLNNGIFNMGKVETNSLNEVKPTNDATNNITFDTLLDTQFFASKINKASDMFERMGYVKNGKLYDYNSEISGIVKEIEAYMQSPASGLEVAHKYVERLSVGNLSNLRDELKLLIVKCIKIEVNVETVMQIVDKAFKMGILDNDSLNDMKEIVAAILRAKDK